MLNIIFSWLLWLTIPGVIIFYLYVNRAYSYWKDRGIAYEKQLFLLGNLGFIMRRSVTDFCFYLKNKQKDYIGIFLGLQPALMVQTSELAKKVLSKDFEYFQNRYLYSGYSDPLGSLNLFTLRNPTWKTMRHELSPMFTALRLKHITEFMNQNATYLVEKVRRDYIEKGKDVNLKELFSMYTSDTVAYSVFGIRVSVLNDQTSPLWLITSHMVKWTFWRGLEFAMIFFIPAVAALLRLKFFSEGASEYIKQIFSNVVKERQQTGKSNDKDLVNHLLKLKESLKIPSNTGFETADNLMLAQVAVFILGSIETSSTALSYCLHELAYHPEKQQKLYDEVSEAIKQSGKDILQYEELVELKYLTGCMNETLRKYPPLSYLDRIAGDEYKLNDDVTVEKGLPVFVNVIAIHYDEKNWPQPEQWQPERFLNIPEGDNVQFNFIPFGDGPRFCIGKRYGMMQIRAALAQLITKYRFEPAEPYAVKSDPYAVILAPKNGGTVKFVLR